MQSFRYAPTQILVHWLVALAVIFLLITGTFILAELPNTTEKIGNLRVHMVLGFLTGVLVLTRLFLRKRKPAAPAVHGQRLATIGHVALNLTVILMVISGILLSVQSGAMSAVFGEGVLPADFMDFTVRRVHGLLSRLLIGLVIIHILAAFYHHFILRDRLLSRMGLAKR